jgi:oligoendopeptidase F
MGASVIQGGIMLNKLSKSWDLEVFFKGGSQSVEFDLYLSDLGNEIGEILSDIQLLPPSITSENDYLLYELLSRVQGVMKKQRECNGFVVCLLAQDVNDKQAMNLQSRLFKIKSRLQTLNTILDKQLFKINDNVWEQLLNKDEFRSISFILNERRINIAMKQSVELESLMNDLSIDGYHAWNRLYNTIHRRTKISIEENGKRQNLSIGQASHYLYRDERDVRKQVFEKSLKAFDQKADFYGITLNHLSGYRLSKYKQRKWNSVLLEPLRNNRMTEETLHTMWEVIDQNKNIYVNFLNHKANLLGLKKLSWYDINAPIYTLGLNISYETGANLIINELRQFSSKMSDFATKAIEDGWIEAEDRSTKRQGGFCSTFPISRQSRIFMTYKDTFKSVITLAHELGHSFHREVIQDLPELNQYYSKSVAETASTFAETIVLNSLINKTKSIEEKIT